MGEERETNSYSISVISPHTEMNRRALFASAHTRESTVWWAAWQTFQSAHVNHALPNANLTLNKSEPMHVCANNHFSFLLLLFSNLMIRPFSQVGQAHVWLVPSNIHVSSSNARVIVCDEKRVSNKLADFEADGEVQVCSKTRCTLRKLRSIAAYAFRSKNNNNNLGIFWSTLFVTWHEHMFSTRNLD